MTHDELLFKIYEIHNDSSDAGQESTKQYRGMIQFMQALRAVVALHKPDESDFPDEWESCVECSCNGYVAMYPCQTIKAIEKELG
jgi:hypothetical protein